MQTSRRLATVALAAGMVVASVVGVHAAPAAPQPALSEGDWVGVVGLAGWYSSETERDDGSFDVSVTDVIFDTSIEFEAVVDADGSLQGTMDVFIVTFEESVGTSPVTFDGYLVETYQETNGQLDLSGDGTRMVASGSLDVLSVIEADGTQLADVGGTETFEVEWIFELEASSCSMSNASLTGATGRTIMQTALLPPLVESVSTLKNGMTVQLAAFPAEVDAIDISDELSAVEDAAAVLAEKETPSAADMRTLIEAWRELSNLLAALDVCEREGVASSEAFEESWLAHQLLVAVIKVTFNDDAYTAEELMDVHDAAAEGGGLNPTYQEILVQQVSEDLAEAALAGEFQTVLNVAVWAASWGYTDLHAQADAAMGDQTP